MIPGPQVFLSYPKKPTIFQPSPPFLTVNPTKKSPKYQELVRRAWHFSTCITLELSCACRQGHRVKSEPTIHMGSLRKNLGPFVQLSEKKINSVSPTWVEMSPSTLQAWFLPPFPSLPRCLPVLCVMGMSSCCVFIVVWNTVGGRNPAPPEMYKTWQIIMGDKLPIRWCRISAINRIIYILSCFEDANNRMLSSWHHFTNWPKNVQRTNCRKNKTWSQTCQNYAWNAG